MTSQIQLGDIDIRVVRKSIKNVHLSVYPPDGRVHISAPDHMGLDKIRIFAISKLGWIKQQQKNIRAQERETQREFVDRESHYLWGDRYLLVNVPSTEPPRVEIKHKQLLLFTRPESDYDKRESIIASWYRDQVRLVASEYVQKWEPVIKVKVQQIFIQKMRTKWGGCRPDRGHIRLNTELAKKSKECLEYIVVHEMVHMIEPHHNKHFTQYMDRLMPHWRQIREELNRAPLAHEDWAY
jgi:predicted metal-dependent hydrolase